ncbi:MAG: glycosyltransferase family 4 protein [bacterium]|nr:glycosyltransferase family 4 protein [bacterium]
MNILYLTKAKLSLSRAKNKNILKTAEILTKLGAHVEVFSSTKESMPTEEILRDKGIENIFLLSFGGGLFSKLKKADVIYFRDSNILFMPLIARLLFSKKVLFEVHGSHEWRWGLMLWKYCIGIATHVVFITERLNKFYGVHKPNLVVHCNGVSFEDYKKEKNRKDLGLPDGTLLMYTGSFLWYSDVVLLKMMKNLNNQATLVVVGLKNDEEENFIKKAKKFGVENRIKIVRRVKSREVAQYLVNADILVNPLVTEYPGSISSKLYEYLAAGKPIVSSFGGANDEIIKNGCNGILVNLNAKEFAEEIDRIIENKNLQDILSRGAKVSAEKYTWDKRGEKILDLIRS